MEISFGNAIKSYNDEMAKNLDVQITRSEIRNFKLVVKNIEWKDIQTLTEKGESTQVHIKGQQKNLYGQVTSEHDLDTFKSVIIKDGVLKGLENTEVTMELPLPESPKNVREGLGNFVRIDPRKAENKLENKTKVTLTSGTENVSNQDGATAKIVTNVRKYEGEFTCDVYPMGNVLLFSGEKPRSTPEIQDVLKNYPAGFKINDKDESVYWTMKGKVDFTWEVDHGHVWKKNEGKM